MSNINQLLKELNACSDAIQWAKDKSFEEIHSTCHRGDWLLWLFRRTNPDNFQLLTLAKGHCANTVRHLMKDERSIKAVDAAIAFGEGKITKDELLAYDAAAYAAAADAYAAAKKLNQQLTADICRKHLPVEIWNVNKLITKP